LELDIEDFFVQNTFSHNLFIAGRRGNLWNDDDPFHGLCQQLPRVAFGKILAVS